MPLLYILYSTTKTDGMECRLTSGYCHSVSYIIDNNEKINVYGRRDDDVCLTYSSHQTRRICQQKKRKKNKIKIAQPYEKEKKI
jgi:hypothetical protein